MDEGRTGIAAIDDDPPPARIERHAAQELAQAVLVGPVGRMDQHADQQPERVDGDGAFAPLDALVPIHAAGPPFSVVLTD